MDETFDIREMAEYLRGDVTGPYQVIAPGPGRPETDRSLLVWFDSFMEEEPFVFSFADDDPQVCLAYVLSSLRTSIKQQR